MHGVVKTSVTGPRPSLSVQFFVCIVHESFNDNRLSYPKTRHAFSNLNRLEDSCQVREYKKTDEDDCCWRRLIAYLACCNCRRASKNMCCFY